MDWGVGRRRCPMAQAKLAEQLPPAIKLIIVDREPAVRSEFASLCRGFSDLQVLGEAESGSAAIDAVERLAPDLMLIEVALPDMSGFDVVRRVGGYGRRLAIMTSHEPDLSGNAIAGGAVDYLSKPVSV